MQECNVSLDWRGTLLNLSLKCIPRLAWDRFKKVDSKCNEWGYLDPKFGLICNYCHYSRVNIWNAMIVMMIMMAVRASIRVYTSCGDVITASTKAKKNMRFCYPKSNNYFLCSLPLYTFSLKLSIVLFNIFVSKMEKIWTFDGKVTRCLKRRGGDPVGLLGSSQQAPPQFQILHMI